MELELTALGLLALLALLALAMALGHMLERKNIRWMSEAGFGIIIGIVFGSILRGSRVVYDFRKMIVFQVDIFMLLLLPPIMFNAGYSVNVAAFKKNLVPLMAFAFAGTTVSMFLVGLTMWLAGRAGLCYEMDLLKSLLFGAIVSATDPVTVLAVFNRLGAEEDVYSMVFGESVLNDAVGMVLFQTVEKFIKHEMAVNAVGILIGFGIFCAIFVGSTIVGAVFGAVASAIARTHFFRTPQSYAEASVMIAFGYSSYLTAQAGHGSGIVAVFACGMVMSVYAKPHLSVHGGTQVKEFWEVAASLAETFVFIYIGTVLFLEREKWDNLRFTAVCLFAVAHSRAFNIFPLSFLVNKVPRSARVNGRQQFMLWWSGLRGGMAAALALSAADKWGADGKVMMTATFILAIITVFVNGGSSSYLLKRLHLQAIKPVNDGGHADGGHAAVGGAPDPHESMQRKPVSAQVDVIIPNTAV